MSRAWAGSSVFVGSPLGLTDKGRGAYPDADLVSRTAFRTMFGSTMVMGAAIHETGGARMGDGPKSSVLNPYNQSWDVPNLSSPPQVHLRARASPARLALSWR